MISAVLSFTEFSAIQQITLESKGQWTAMCTEERDKFPHPGGGHSECAFGSVPWDVGTMDVSLGKVAVGHRAMSGHRGDRRRRK